MTDNVLEIKNLCTYFDTSAGVVKAVDGTSLNLPRGKVTALVGESGCGKSMTALSILRLIQSPGRIAEGEILFHPREGGAALSLLSLPEKEMCAIRGNKIAMIFQEPMTSLNPVFTVGEQIAEAVRLHQKANRKVARARAIEMLQKVGIPNPESRVDDYPHQLSGGMRQRVMIAMALSCNPELLIADEPTTALDVTIQAQILELMAGLIKEFNMSMLLITHDLGIVAEYADQVAVMYAGKMAEQAPVGAFFKQPAHPYSRGLLASLPGLKQKGERLSTIPGVVPHLAKLPRGCSFQDRCERVHDDCRWNDPFLKQVKPEHLVRCFDPYL